MDLAASASAAWYRPCREHLLQPDRHIRRNSGMAVQQIGQRLTRNAKSFGSRGDGETKRLEALLPDDLARMSRAVHLHLTISFAVASLRRCRSRAPTWASMKRVSLLWRAGIASALPVIGAAVKRRITAIPETQGNGFNAAVIVSHIVSTVSSPV
jgi:hypothetical protein